MSVIIITLKWAVGLLCGYVITTPEVTQAHHIPHQSVGCVVMMSRLFLVKVLHSHNDNSKRDFFFFFFFWMYLDGFSRYMYQRCCLNLFFSCVFYCKTAAISTCTAKCGKRFILVGVHSKFLWGCHFLNYGEKHWFWSLLCGSRKNL